MGKEYRCPTCRNEVDPAATVCSNPECRDDLAFCSACRDVTTYTLSEARSGRFARDLWKCSRCLHLGVKCWTWLAGGYCNGLARAGGRHDKQLCARCMDRVGEVGRTVVGWSLVGAFGGLLKPRK
jgi:hypothetical protein